MTNWNEVEYQQISEDWRHRDNLTWQIPSIIVVIGGALITAAFALNTDPKYLCIVRPILLGFGALLSLCLTFALAQNLWYQVGSGEALIKIANDEGYNLPKDEMRRTLSPKDFCISKKREFIKRLFTKLTGSTLLLILCICIAFILSGLFIWSIVFTKLTGSTLLLSLLISLCIYIVFIFLGLLIWFIISKIRHRN